MKERQRARQDTRNEKLSPAGPLRVGRIALSPCHCKTGQDDEAERESEDARSLWKKHIGNDVRPDQCLGWQVAIVRFETCEKLPKAVTTGPPVLKEVDEPQATIEEEKQRS